MQYIEFYYGWKNGEMDFNTIYHTITTTIGLIPTVQTMGASMALDGVYCLGELTINTGQWLLQNMYELNAFFMDMNTWNNRYNTGEWYR